MAYRNGTYVAFAAGGTTDFTSSESDIRYFNLLKAWSENENMDFSFINSHEKVSAVRDSSSKETLRQSLCTRLNNSKNMLLLLSNNTRKDTDWVPFEIAYAIDKCGLPIIVSYVDITNQRVSNANSAFYPSVLAARINNGTARTIHIPFHITVIKKAIDEFSFDNLPKYPVTVYNDNFYNNL